MKPSKTLDMCSGPFFRKIIWFMIPLIFSGLLQVFFNAADTVVLGQFAGDNELSAVGSTACLINALVNLAIGLSNGAGVVVAQNVGAKNSSGVHKTVHTAILLSLISGVVLGLLGIGISRPVLKVMNTPVEVLPLSDLYMKIYFAGLPVQMLYNFGSSILRSVGDTQRPLVFLSISGVVNIVLNIFFVAVLGMTVSGVALATVISQALSAVLLVRYMQKLDNDCRLELRKLKIHRRLFVQILNMGIPAGINGMLFSISNVIIQSSINSFGTTVMAGNAAATNLESFVYIPMNAVSQTTTAFVGQNTGARKFEQIRKLTRMFLLIVTVIGLGLGSLVCLFGQPLLRIFTSTPEAIHYGYERLLVICLPYFTCGIMDVMSGSIRGMGQSMLPMLISFFCVCGFRLIWIFTLLPWHHYYTFILYSYSISWVVTFLLLTVTYFAVHRNLEKKGGLYT